MNLRHFVAEGFDDFQDQRDFAIDNLGPGGQQELRDAILSKLDDEVENSPPSEGQGCCYLDVNLYELLSMRDIGELNEQVDDEVGRLTMDIRYYVAGVNADGSIRIRAAFCIDEEAA